jgi:hypothetical protein
MPFAGRGTIDEINLLAIPVAVNLDGMPGVDGFVIKIYASSRKRPKPVAIEDGTIEIDMFDGIPTAAVGAPPKPLRTWKYTASELRPFLFQSSIGAGYEVAVAWGDAKPASNKIAVLVRYAPPSGTGITSAPSIISVVLE